MTVLGKRSASYFLQVLTIMATPLVLVGLTASAGSAATTAPASVRAPAPTYFGAKLTSQSEPSNAENGQRCDEQGGIRHGATCTWVAISAFENGSNFTAPRTGTIKHVKLVSCKAGKFRLFLANANVSAGKAKLVFRGPPRPGHQRVPGGLPGRRRAQFREPDGLDLVQVKEPPRVHEADFRAKPPGERLAGGPLHHVAVEHAPAAGLGPPRGMPQERPAEAAPPELRVHGHGHERPAPVLQVGQHDPAEGRYPFAGPRRPERVRWHAPHLGRVAGPAVRQVGAEQRE